MNLSDRLSFGFGTRLPMLLQTEATECALASLAMVAAHHGYRSDMASLRRRFPVSLKGGTLAFLMKAAAEMSLASRPVKLRLSELRDLKLPCILHWNFNHFVVLKEVGARSVVIHDPACGVRTLPLSEVSKCFTGVALELWPNAEFKAENKTQPIRLRSLMGNISGLYRSLGQILVLALALEVFTLVNPLFMQWVLDHVLVSADHDLLSLLAIGFAGVMIMQQAISMLRSWAIMVMSTTLNLQWRANVFTHLVRLPMQYFEKRHLGDVQSRFSAVDQIQGTLTTSFLEAVMDGIMTVLTVAMMLLLSPLLSCVALGVMALYLLARWAWYRPLRNATEEQIIHAARQQTHFLETLRGVKAVKLFQREDERRTAWLTLLVEQINAGLRTQKLDFFYKNLSGILFSLESVLLVWLGARSVLAGTFSVGVLMAFDAYRRQVDSRVPRLIDKYFEMKMLQLQGARLADIVMSEPELETATAADMSMNGGGPSDAGQPAIVVSGLRYRYAEGEDYVLNGVELKVAEGECVAVVGPSGCGKSTLFNVMLGVLPYAEGRVTIGGVELKRDNLQKMRSLIGTVTQDDVLFAGSIADNICFFDAEPDQAWIEDCARMAAIHIEIKASPMGYNTLVGDMGTVLSGGQKQRILLARALYRRPKILFLDEATSHLDVEREREVNESIRALKITRVIIAHRPETIASADRIITLWGGQVVPAFNRSQPGAATQALPQAA